MMFGISNIYNLHSRQIPMMFGISNNYDPLRSLKIIVYDCMSTQRNIHEVDRIEDREAWSMTHVLW